MFGKNNIGGSSRTTLSPGPGVDAQGAPVVDPTKNVIDILAAAVERIDDLRQAEVHRQDDLRDAFDRHTTDVANLRAVHATELRKAEADRLDAIRASDAAVVNRAAEVQQQVAGSLATQVAVSAETLRTQVQAAAAAATVALTAALEPIQKDIADLRKAQYEAQGQRTNVVDSRSEMTANNQRTSLVIAIVVAIFSFLFGITGIGFAIVQFALHK